MEKLTFTSDDGEAIEYFVLGEQTIKGTDYLLVTERNEGDTDALILKRIPDENDSDMYVYENVNDEDELSIAMEAFSRLLEDIEFE
ncbi:DUF1292 domain-containing protein [Lachnospiraceae bacterium C1.1]|nr:DUF1292 domain-containing protein [Lachnospiraceae bacterium C1.1]